MQPRTFHIQTLGCRVNQYEAEQLAALLRSRGLSPADEPDADLRLIHTCSVTVQAAGKSRQWAKRVARQETTARVQLPVLPPSPHQTVEPSTGDLTESQQIEPGQPGATRLVLTGCWATSDPSAARNIPGVDAVITHHDDVAAEIDRLLSEWREEAASGTPWHVGGDADLASSSSGTPRQTSDDHTSDDHTSGDRSSDNQSRGTAGNTSSGRTAGNYDTPNKPIGAPGVNGKIALPTTPAHVVGSTPFAFAGLKTITPSKLHESPPPVLRGRAREGVRAADMIGGNGKAPEDLSGPAPAPFGSPDTQSNTPIPRSPPPVARTPSQISRSTGGGDEGRRRHAITSNAPRTGFATLPLLSDAQSGRQRALLKIQDGCDAHCTYCIIPQLRPTLWSKPIDDAVEEATRLVAAGHVEIVLTGIFLGAFGQATALRRRQPSVRSPLADLVDALCTRVPGLRRLRLSSLEPGDLGGDLLAALRSHEQVVPHFHLPLQSGSERLLRKMNRQYGRDDFLKMADEVKHAFDRPALTTDVIAGFPGEDDAAFADTADVVRRVGFIHVHAFHFSPRPRTAAARWQKDFVRGPVVGQRVDQLRAIADEASLAFRRSFVGQTVELLVEHDTPTAEQTGLRHGRCERYFDVWFDAPEAKPGDFVQVKVTEATPTRTRGELFPLPCTQGRGQG